MNAAMMQRFVSRPPSSRTILIRTYRGQAGQETKNLSVYEQDLVNKALPKSQAIMETHIAMPNLADIPPASLHGTVLTDSQDEASAAAALDTIRRKRLIYRAKQRGWLEVDLLLGTWASDHVPTLSETELQEFEDFCNQETIDIYNIVTLKVDLEPDQVTPTKDSVVERIQEWAKQSPLGKADPAAYKNIKAKANLT